MILGNSVITRFISLRINSEVTL
ncbi:hypothetical protein MED222_06045 [Vibrio sp. MED222]|nr:hypothetical protein MED222_06045 [Vibrio sp. MED222]